MSKDFRSVRYKKKELYKEQPNSNEDEFFKKVLRKRQKK